jgi:extradiol dioxygenase family protein
MSCNHTRETSRWVTLDYFGEEIDGEWEYTTESTTVDIDLHRYKCTQCGEIMYYSGRARDYYEKGIKSEWITGLDK